MEKIQIIGYGLELPIKDLNILGKRIYETKETNGYKFEVWEMSKSELERLNHFSSDDWNNKYKESWWRFGGCNHTGNEIEFIVNDKKMIGFQEEYHYMHDPEYWELEEGEKIPQLEFDNLLEYLRDYINISTEYNFSYFIETLSEINNISKAEFLKLYW